MAGVSLTTRSAKAQPGGRPEVIPLAWKNPEASWFPTGGFCFAAVKEFSTKWMGLKSLSLTRKQIGSFTVRKEVIAWIVVIVPVMALIDVAEDL
jgi:hypothetical protein